jgi:RNA polymerase sigma-70 factor (ECF subfamily)
MELYRRYGPAIRRKCERMLGNTEDAEDVMQALFLSLWDKGSTDVELPYLYRAATNRCLNELRNRKKQRDLLAREGRGEPSTSRINTQENRVSSSQLISNLVSRIDKKSAEILVYYYLDDMTQDEIAALMNISRRTIGKKLKKIRLSAAELELEAC